LLRIVVPLLKDLLKFLKQEWRGLDVIAVDLMKQCKAHGHRLTGSYGLHTVRAGLSAYLLRINPFVHAMDDVVVDSILHKRRAVWNPVKMSRIRLVLGKQQFR